ncbi:ABC transporter permease [Treponema pedis]|uniref:Iron ABC transporter permease n=1 Tax=Treponema pedis TaxID=409322 RepID=A0A7S6WQF3_9SPIR|nr:iron ABC transporter permease [Treponema pedis]QOW61421.1 iron ABC transporter permease [Treponema pedis]
MFYKIDKFKNKLFAAGRKFTVPAAGLIFFAVILSFLIPLFLSFVPLFSSHFDFSHFTGAVIYDKSSVFQRIFRIALFTIVQALISAFLGTVIGLAAAYFCAKKNFRGRKFLLSLSGVPLCIPAIIIALAFIVFFGNNGVVNSVLKTIFKTDEPVLKFLFTMTGVIVVHSFYNFPIAMRTVSQVWENLNEDEENAAALLGANKFRIFKTVTFPALLNSISASFLLIFLFCFFSFIIILLFGGLGITTLEVELYKSARASLNMNLAAKISLIEIIVSGFAIVLYAHVQKKLEGKNQKLKQKNKRTNLNGKLEKFFFSFMFITIFLFLIAPLFSVFLRSTHNVNYTDFFNKYFEFKAWKKVLSSSVFLYSLWTTIKIGVCTSFVTLTASLFFAYITVFSKPKKITAIIPYLPLAVSSVMLGFGWTLLRPNGSVAVLILAQSALAWPFAWTQIQIPLLRIPKNIFNAALIFSANKQDAFFRCIIPLCKRGVISAFGFVFAISAGDASLPIILNIPRFENLSLLLYDYASSYRFAESAAVAVILAVITGFVFFLQDRGGDKDE